MTTTVSHKLAGTTGYDVNATEYVTDGATNFSSFSDFTGTTTGYDIATNRAINFSEFGNGSRPLLSNSGCLAVNLSRLLLHDDSDDPISSTTMQLLNGVKGTVLLPMIFFVGFPTNCLNMLVFFKHDLKQRINLCLFCLSLVDLIYITFIFVMYAESIRPGGLTASYWSLGPAVTFIINNHLLGLYGFGWASMFVSAIISGERCFCVIWPLRSSTLLKTRTTAIVLLIGVALIAAGRFAVTEKYRVVCLFNVATGQTLFQLTVSRFYFTHKRLVDVLDGLVYGMVVPITMCTFVTMATVVTAVKLKQVAQWRKESSSALSAREIALTRMLIYLSVQFIAFNLPNILLRVTAIFVPDLSSTGRFANLFFFMTGAAEVCTALNSSLNFLVYYFAGTKYRETVRGLCGKASTRKEAVYVDTSVSIVNAVPP